MGFPVVDVAEDFLLVGNNLGSLSLLLTQLLRGLPLVLVSLTSVVQGLDLGLQLSVRSIQLVVALLQFLESFDISFPRSFHSLSLVEVLLQHGISGLGCSLLSLHQDHRLPDARLLVQAGLFFLVQLILAGQCVDDDAGSFPGVIVVGA